MPRNAGSVCDQNPAAWPAGTGEGCDYDVRIGYYCCFAGLSCVGLTVSCRVALSRYLPSFPLMASCSLQSGLLCLHLLLGDMWANFSLSESDCALATFCRLCNNSNLEAGEDCEDFDFGRAALHAFVSVFAARVRLVFFFLGGGVVVSVFS